MATEAMQKAFLDLCLGQHDNVGDRTREALVRAGVAREDIEAIPKPRFWLYRRLVRGNVVDLTQSLLERTSLRLEAHAPGELIAAFDAFLAEEAPHTHHLRDVPSEFVAWVAPRWSRGERVGKGGEAVPSYFGDFARWEIAHFTTGTRQHTPREDVTDIDVARAVVLHGSATLLTTEHAIHALEASTDKAPGLPEHARSHYLFYRDPSHETRVLHLTPFVGGFASRALGGELLGACIQGAAAELGVSASEVTQELAKMLADWAERGVLLGGAS